MKTNLTQEEKEKSYIFQNNDKKVVVSEFPCEIYGSNCFKHSNIDIKILRIVNANEKLRECLWMAGLFYLEAAIHFEGQYHDTTLAQAQGLVNGAEIFFEDDEYEADEVCEKVARFFLQKKFTN